MSEGNLQGFCDAIGAFWKREDAVSVIDGMLEGGGVVCFSITCRAEVFNVAHLSEPSGFLKRRGRGKKVAKICNLGSAGQAGVMRTKIANLGYV